ncbi:MAG: putative alpha-E superfamily protein, partial [Sulfurimonas sp.]
RTYALKVDKEKYSVMNGGLVRVSENKDSLVVDSKHGSISKDLWVLGKDEIDINLSNILSHTPYVETSIENISTLKASNLFWLGRYLARAISTTRLLINIIKKITNYYRYEVVISKESQNILHNALTHMTKTYPGFVDIYNKESLDIFPMDEITSVIKDTLRSGSLSFTILMLSNTNVNLKDLLTIESWKLFERMQKEWNDFVYRKGDSTLLVASELEKFLIYLMAYKELVNESIFKEQGLVLFKIGYQIEDSLLLISKARSILCLKVNKNTRNTLLEGVLNSMESFNAYRSHYKSSLNLENVIDFLLLNKQFPKSLSYVTDKLLSDFKLLPKGEALSMPYKQALIKVQEILTSIDVKTITKIKEQEGVYVELDEILAKLSDLFLECSNEFSNKYFAHYDE